MGAGDHPSWALRLSEAGAAELLRLIEENSARIDVPALRLALRNPCIDRPAIEALARAGRLLVSYEARRELASHPRTPEPLAERLVPGLYWPDLGRIGADARVRPAVRRSADRRLARRLPALALGERIALARRAGSGVLEELRHDPEPLVIGALLDNPRLTEPLLLPLANDCDAPPAILGRIAVDRRWGTRCEIRSALCRNPRTPVGVALDLLPHLAKRDLTIVEAAGQVDPAVRRRAALLLGRGEASMFDPCSTAT